MHERFMVRLHNGFYISWEAILFTSLAIYNGNNVILHINIEMTRILAHCVPIQYNCHIQYQLRGGLQSDKLIGNHANESGLKYKDQSDYSSRTRACIQELHI